MDFGIPETQNQSIILLLEGNKEILNQLNVMAEEFGIAPSVMQTIAVELLGQMLPQQTENRKQRLSVFPQKSHKLLTSTSQDRKIL